MRVPAFGLAAVALVLSAPVAKATDDTRCAAFSEQFRSEITTSDVKRFMSDTTYRSYSDGHGNQIEYATPGGRVFLWYPGNRVILPGHWKVVHEPIRVPTQGIDCRAPKLVQLCFQYGAETYNPVTGSRGLAWECQPFELFRKTRVEVVRGDPLGLASMKQPPFVLPRNDRPIAAVEAQLRNR
ncbi:hypothetical protein EYW49_12950 [Siculibacillus lacustris]|uniref:DUF995 domain-containing protein n=1 Tax=Siculibacillus lacustris TaxID=1549641 RepID=A0A4Q9VQ37_9HYPH|nr:hypothetical protein [Siculibacillus lacustris]TBW37051.1 hypothetical protein EYW49_12950 [Siculibacillus lacustris]